MATRSKSGLFPIIVLAGVAVLVFGGDRALDMVTVLVGGSKAQIIGQGDASIAVAGGARSKLDDCAVIQMLNDRRCGNVKIVVIDAARMPFISRNISLAWATGRPFELTKNKAAEDANRAQACGRFKPRFDESSCDEYPFAGTDQGGSGARTEEVPLRENKCQGGTLRQAYARAGITEGDSFIVVIGNPDRIATDAYAGVDIAKDRSACG